MELLNAIGCFADASPQGSARCDRKRSTSQHWRFAPITPHVCHAFAGSGLGHSMALVDERWPVADPEALAQQAVEIVLQLNGKLRGRISVPVDSDAAVVRAAALADEHVRKFVADHNRCAV